MTAQLVDLTGRRDWPRAVKEQLVQACDDAFEEGLQVTVHTMETAYGFSRPYLNDFLPASYDEACRRRRVRFEGETHERLPPAPAPELQGPKAPWHRRRRPRWRLVWTAAALGLSLGFLIGVGV